MAAVLPFKKDADAKHRLWVRGSSPYMSKRRFPLTSRFAATSPRTRGEVKKDGAIMSPNPPVISGTRIGHVHLKVADLDRALGFYCDVLGFELQQRMGDSAAFISAGGYHHHIGLNTWESKGGHPPPPGT